MPDPELFREANRQLVICNSCRYCEGYCPVFRAIEIRRTFSDNDVRYLANLCHDCRACLYACMYAPPHEFSVNIPKMMSEVRIATYRRWSRPKMVSYILSNARIEVVVTLAIWISTILFAAMLIGPSRLLSRHLGPGAFYQVVPYRTIVIAATALCIYWMAVWMIGGAQFLSETVNSKPQISLLKAVFRAIKDALILNYLRGGGPGCYYPGDRPSFARRFYHTLTSWGFACAVVSTSIAAVYQEVFHWLPPFAATSAPVIFGILGGVAMTIGSIGLIYIKLRSDKALADTNAAHMDLIFLGMLFLTSISGLLTLAFRSSPALGILLVIHLGLVASLFVTAPYGKFVHVVYRFLALVRHATEQNQPG